MNHFKEIEFACINISSIPKQRKHVDARYISKQITSTFEMFWTEPPFRANLLFGYLQSGPERTCFSGIFKVFLSEPPFRNQPYE